MNAEAYFVQAYDIPREQLVSVRVLTIAKEPWGVPAGRVSWEDHWDYDDAEGHTRARLHAATLAAQWATLLHNNPDYGTLPASWGANY